MSKERKNSVTGGTNNGVQFVGGGSNSGGIHIYTVASPEGGDPQQVDIKSARPLPLSLGWINTLAAGFSVLTFLTGWRGWSLFTQGESLDDATGRIGISSFSWWVIAFVAWLMLAALGFSANGFLRLDVMKFSRLAVLSVVVGARCRDGKTRPMLVRFTVNCRECGGKMRFLNRETEGRDLYFPDGEVTARRPHAVCKRNPDHAAQIDIAKSSFDKPIW